MKVRWEGNLRNPSQWRFNSTLLANDDGVSDIMNHFTNCFTENSPPDIDVLVICNVYKASLHGECIALAATRRKAELEKERFLEQVVGQLEAEHRMNPCSRYVLERLTHYRFLLNKTVSARMQCLQARDSAKLYAGANTSGKVMANDLRSRTQRNKILNMTDSSRNTVHTAKGISQVFQDFYYHLFRSKVNPSEEEWESHDLNEPISIEEIRLALFSMPQS